MTGPQFRTILRDLNLSMQGLARLSGLGGRTIRWYSQYGLDEGAGGAQAAIAAILRILRRLPPEIRRPIIDDYSKRKRHQ